MFSSDIAARKDLQDTRSGAGSVEKPGRKPETY
jgi:hypothetical protein